MKRKTIVVICNDVEWTHKSGYSFANGLYYELSKKYFVKIIMISDMDFFTETTTRINDHMMLEKVFISDVSLMACEKTSERYYREKFLYQDKELIERLINSAKDADVIIANSIFISKLVCTAFPDKNFIYRELDTFFYGMNENFKYAYKNIEIPVEALEMQSDFLQLENLVVEKSSLILTLTEDDENILTSQCGVDRHKMLRMPLCVQNVQRYDSYVPRERKKSNAKINCIYLSSQYFGSDMLLHKIIEIAHLLPNFEFHFIGTCCHYLANEVLPENCFSHGIVSDEEKALLCSLADCALSLPFQSHGMNAKNFDYFLNGIVVLADEYGIRGFGAEENIHYFKVGYDTLENDLRSFMNTDYEFRRKLALSAYNHVVSKFRYENYIPEFERLSGLSENDTHNDMNNKTKCYIWGAFSSGGTVLERLKFSKYCCVGFIDNDQQKQGQSYCGLPVVSFDTAISTIIDSKAYIILAVRTFRNISKIYKQIISSLPKDRVLLFYRNFLYEDGVNLDKLLVEEK